jgi:hypothetical protein
LGGFGLRGGMSKGGPDLEQTKRLMAALGRMPPKQHKDMKLGKPKAKSKASPAKKGAGQVGGAVRKAKIGG